jgi:hypothetical protein
MRASLGGMVRIDPYTPERYECWDGLQQIRDDAARSDTVGRKYNRPGCGSQVQNVPVRRE